MLGTKERWSLKTGNLFKETQFIWIFYDRKRKRWPFKTGDLLTGVQFTMKFSMTGQEKGDLLIQVTA